MLPSSANYDSIDGHFSRDLRVTLKRMDVVLEIAKLYRELDRPSSAIVYSARAADYMDHAIKISRMLEASPFAAKHIQAIRLATN